MESGFAALMTILLSYLLIVLFITVLLVVATWKIFTKAGEAGWKSLIPIYSQYVTYRICWNTNMFWAWFGCWLVYVLILNFVSGGASMIGVVFGIAMFVIALLQNLKLAKAFGRGTGFGLGLVFLSPIFYMILGFSDSKYIGPQE